MHCMSANAEIRMLGEHTYFYGAHRISLHNVDALAKPASKIMSIINVIYNTYLYRTLKK